MISIAQEIAAVGPTVFRQVVKKKTRILMVDDNRDGVLARRSVLEELGYQVISAGCGEFAIHNRSMCIDFWIR